MLQKVVFLSGGTAEARLRGLPATSRCREERVFREREKPNLKKKPRVFCPSFKNCPFSGLASVLLVS